MSEDPNHYPPEWEQAAAAGNTDAMVNLGLLLRDRDPDAAQALWERAAAAGNTDARDNLGRCWPTGIRPRRRRGVPGGSRGVPCRRRGAG